MQILFCNCRIVPAEKDDPEDETHILKDPRIKVTECSTCRILSASELADYSCGAAPSTNSLEDLLREKGPIPRPGRV